jgi:excisionase family DNA binding protein
VYETRASATMTVAECVKVTGFSRSAIYGAIKRGELPGVVRIGRSIRLSREVIRRWLAGEIESQSQGSRRQLAVHQGGAARG